jgi:hypothetical protein
LFERFFMKRWLATAAARRAVAPARVSWPEEFIKGGTMEEGILFKAKKIKRLNDGDRT